jgi:biotin carboxyl carrier protein
MQHRAYIGYHGQHEVSYSVDPDGFPIEGVGLVVLDEASPDAVSFRADGVEFHYQTARYGDDRYVHSENGPAHLIAVPRFLETDSDEDVGSLHAPMPGRVIRVEVAVADHVVEGQVMVVIEAMKMEHTLRSPHNGTVVDVRHLAGDQIDADAVLVVVEED